MGTGEVRSRVGGPEERCHQAIERMAVTTPSGPHASPSLTGSCAIGVGAVRVRIAYCRCEVVHAAR